MTEVACFCGWCYSFQGDIGACPQCGEYTSFSRASHEEEQQMHAELDVILTAPTLAATHGRAR